MSRSDWNDLERFSPWARRQIEAAQKAQPTRLEARERAAGQRAGRQHPEEDLQRTVIAWADLTPLYTFMRAHWDEWAVIVECGKVGQYLIHVPNGGHRSAAEAGIFKAIGVRAGVADLFLHLPVRRPDEIRAGLWIELKAPGGRGKESDHQAAFAARCRAVGYDCVLADSLDWVQDAIEEYLRAARPLLTTKGEP